MMRAQHDSFMFEEMMKIVKCMSAKIDDSMHSIFKHLTAHKEWPKLVAIQNQVLVERQDDGRVGLLQEQGISH